MVTGKRQTMGELVHGYFLYVNDQQDSRVFGKREEAEEAAKPHIASRAKLRIQTTTGLVRKWNYDYDLGTWNLWADNRL